MWGVEGKMGLRGFREIAYWVQSLSCKCKHLYSIPTSTYKARHGGMCLGFQRQGGGNRQGL